MQIRFSTAFAIVALVSVVSASLRAEPSSTTASSTTIQPAPLPAAPTQPPAAASAPATPAPNKAGPSDAASPKPPASVTVISNIEARGILGREVRSAADEDMGRIVDVIVDRGGQVRAAVIDFGGFLGVGSRKIVVDWAALRFGNVTHKDGKMTLELTRDQVRAAPEYKDNQPIVALGASGSLEPLRFAPATEH
ncbi:PRC-barrel domain-containing protein [Rhodopseudomonas palustris]|uniref:PRC-barrel n=1 Tax=Rhodopseudomonas palustris (strain BisB18) TaxID=316056 RepID=Q212D2_RHOPB